MPPKGSRKRTGAGAASPHNTSSSSGDAANSPRSPARKKQRLEPCKAVKLDEGPKVVSYSSTTYALKLEYNDLHKRMLKNVGDEDPAFYVHLNPAHLATVAGLVNARGAPGVIFRGYVGNPIATAESVERDLIEFIVTLPRSRQGSSGTLIAPNTQVQCLLLVNNTRDLCYDAEVIALAIPARSLPLGCLYEISNPKTLQVNPVVCAPPRQGGVPLWQ